jgi:hypothetical protein
VNLLNYVVNAQLETGRSTLKQIVRSPASAWMHFLTSVTRELVNFRSTAALLMLLLAALKIRWISSSLVFTLCAYTIAFI